MTISLAVQCEEDGRGWGGAVGQRKGGYVWAERRERGAGKHRHCFFTTNSQPPKHPQTKHDPRTRNRHDPSQPRSPLIFSRPPSVMALKKAWPLLSYLDVQIIVNRDWVGLGFEPVGLLDKNLELRLHQRLDCHPPPPPHPSNPKPHTPNPKPPNRKRP